MSEEDPSDKIRRLMRESYPDSRPTESMQGQVRPEEESALQAAFFKRTGISCGRAERDALEALCSRGNGFPYKTIKKLKLLDHLIWDQQKGQHFVRLVGVREVVASFALLSYVGICLVFLAYVLREELWGRASAPHYGWSAGSALAALGFMALLYNLLWIPLHEALPVKRALAEMHGAAESD